jgi:hypothetical protein
MAEDSSLSCPAFLNNECCSGLLGGRSLETPEVPFVLLKKRSRLLAGSRFLARFVDFT